MKALGPRSVVVCRVILTGCVRVVIEALRSLAMLMAQILIPSRHSAEEIRWKRGEDVESMFLFYSRFDAVLRKECGINIASQASIVHISLGVFE
jgi:hypothetical protein